MNYLLLIIWLFFLISAFNSANNLFHLVFALFTAFFAAPYYIASRAGSALAVNLEFSNMLFAGSTAEAALEVINNGNEEKFMLEFIGTSSDQYDFAAAHLDYLEARGSKKIGLNFNLKKRGLLVPPLSVKSNIPLLVKEKRITIEHGKRFIVYARIADIQFKNPGITDKTNLKKRVFNSDYGQLSRFKNYGAGDSPSKINWRHYSVSKTLIIPQNEEKNSVNYSIILLLGENYPCFTLPYELAVSCASSIAMALNGRRAAFNLITVSDKVKSFGSAGASIEKILSYLALLDKSHTISRAALTRALNTAHAASDIFVIATQPFEDAEFLHKYLGGRLRKIILTREPGFNEAPGGKKVLIISALEQLSANVI